MNGIGGQNNMKMNGDEDEASESAGVENGEREGGGGDYYIDSSFGGARDAWVELEQAMGRAIGLEWEDSDKDDDVSAIESSRNITDNTSLCHERSMATATATTSGEVDDDLDGVENLTAEEPEIINAGEIPSELTHDTEEITNESDVILDTGRGGSEFINEEVDDDNANSSNAQCTHPINPYQPQLDEDCQGGDQNGNQELDSSHIVCDSFQSYPAEVIPEAVPVNDSSNGYHARVNSAAVPPSAMSITSELKNKDTLLRREVLVNDIVSKLQDSSFENESYGCDDCKNVVLLRGYGGTGKSVLCSMVASNRSTLLHFVDGVVWLSLSQVRGEDNRGGMTYDLYVDFLETICKQLDLEVPSFDEPIALSTDDSSVLRQKEQAAMEAAKATMCRLLSDRQILIVLDDVWSRSAISWLNLSNTLDSHLRVLVSTRLQGGYRKAKVIDVEKLSLQEATTLLISESGCQHAALTTEEESLAVDIVKRCSLPVAICIAGRMLLSSNNRCEAFRKLSNEMSEALAFQIDPYDTTFDLTDRCFTGIGGEPLKASFVAFSVTFTTDEGKRTFVSAAAATKVLEALLLPVDKRDLDCKNGTVLVLQQLHDMGLLERQGDNFKVHHDLGQEYAKQVLNDKQEREILFANRLSRPLGKRLGRKSTKCAESLVSALHLLYAREYTSKVDTESYWQTVADDEYVFQRLPWHVMSSSLHQSHHLATNLLCSPSFLKRRVAAMDILPCVKAHIHDMEVLRGKSHTKKEKERFQGEFETSFDVILDYIATEVAPHECGKAYMLLALYFQQQFRFSNAMEMYSRAHATFQREGLEEEADLAQKRAEKIAFKPICLVPKSASSEHIIRFEDVASLLAQQENATTKEDYTDVNIGSTVSADSGIKLTLSSHAGMALCLSDRCQHYPGQDFYSLCIGPAESAISVKYAGDRFVGCHGGRSCLATGVGQGGEGDMLFMGIYRYSNKTFGRCLDKIYGKTNTSDLVVNEDGSLSPRSSDLVFAVRSPQLSLVKRDSPCRLIFKHGEELQTSQAPSTSQDCPVNRDKVFSGELLSHPGYAICHDVEIKTNAKFSGDTMKLCNVSDSAQFVYDGQKLGAVVDGKCKYFLTNGLGVGEGSANVYLIRDESESRTIFNREFAFGLHWVINDDGSLSPSEYPTHAIGAHCVSSTELVVTEEQRMLAKNAAKRRVRMHRCESMKHNLHSFRLLLFTI